LSGFGLWSQSPEYFEARTNYLQLADKATRTVMMLTERLDHHRGRGQQQIIVSHVTTANNISADHHCRKYHSRRRARRHISRPFC
jgi:hypothetical protein